MRLNGREVAAVVDLNKEDAAELAAGGINTVTQLLDTLAKGGETLKAVGLVADSVS